MVLKVVVDLVKQMTCEGKPASDNDRVTSHACCEQVEDPQIREAVTAQGPKHAAFLQEKRRCQYS